MGGSLSKVSLFATCLAVSGMAGTQGRPPEDPQALAQAREVLKTYTNHLAFLDRIRCRTIGDCPELEFEGVAPLIKVRAIHEAAHRRGSQGLNKRFDAIWLLTDAGKDYSVNPEVSALCLASLDPEVRRAGAIGLYYQEDDVRWEILDRFEFPKNSDTDAMLTELRKPRKSMNLDVIQAWWSAELPPMP